MIIVKLTGGLGNQMFQYATAKSLAVRNNTELLLDIKEFKTYKLHNYSLDKFNISAKIAENKQTMSITNQIKFGKFIDGLLSVFTKYPRITYYKENGLNFNENVLNLPNNVYLDGYFQSEKYFEGIREIILNEFTVKSKQTGKNASFSEQMRLENSVSLHIRRGDYIKNNYTNKTHGTCSLDYYNNALNYIASKLDKLVVYVFSDDLTWVKENLEINHKTIYVENNDTEHNYEDLRLMTECKHNIIANSSFSWWGAWLNKHPDKIVVAPEKWFAKTKPNDIVPETWVRM